MIKSHDHLQIAIPEGTEDVVRPFYALLGFRETLKPVALAGRGGIWMTCDVLELHIGVDPIFVPATKAHPAFVVDALDDLAVRLGDAGHNVMWDTKLEHVKRCFVSDPVGNRIELIAA